MRETIENKVEITDVSSKIFSAFLEYIYTNQLPKLKPTVRLFISIKHPYMPKRTIFLKES
jgi:hypothetical protein